MGTNVQAPWSKPLRAYQRVVLAANPAGAASTPGPLAPSAGLVELKGNFDACEVWGQFPVSWADVWLALYSTSRKEHTPLQVRQVSSLQSPQRTLDNTGALTHTSGVIFSVSERPASSFQVVAFLHSAAITDPAFVEMVASGGAHAGSPGDQAMRPTVNVQARPDQQFSFQTPLANVAGVAQVIQAANPTGGRLAITSMQWSTENGAASQFQIQELTALGAVALLTLRNPPGGTQLPIVFPLPLWSQPGSSLQYQLIGGGTHALNFQGFRE